jgi:hypothetical protein
MLPSLVALGLAGVVAAASPSQLPRKSLAVHVIHRCLPTANCPPMRIVTRMKDETERIWLSLDVQIAWIDSIDAGTEAHPAGLTVMLEEFDPPWPAERGFLLAELHQPASACDWGLARVWVRQIRRHVASVRREGHPFTTLPTALADTLLGRALGRALAHEIGHYLIGTAEHAAHGLMRARFAPQELLADAIQPLYCLSSHERAALMSCRTDRHADRMVVDETSSSPPADRKSRAADRE